MSTRATQGGLVNHGEDSAIFPKGKGNLSLLSSIELVTTLGSQAQHSSPRALSWAGGCGFPLWMVNSLRAGTKPYSPDPQKGDQHMAHA